MRYFLILLLCASQGLMAAEKKQSSEHREIIESCKTEGVSVGFEGADLKEFIDECVVDFLDTTMVVTPAPGSARK